MSVIQMVILAQYILNNTYKFMFTPSGTDAGLFWIQYISTVPIWVDRTYPLCYQLNNNPGVGDET